MTLELAAFVGASCAAAAAWSAGFLGRRVVAAKAEELLDEVLRRHEVGRLRVRDGTIVEASPRFEAMLGHEAGGLAGIPMLSLVDEKDRSRVAEDVLRDGGERRLRFRLEALRRDGSAVLLEVLASASGEGRTRTLEMLAFEADGPAPASMPPVLPAEASCESARRLQHVVAHAPLIFFALDADGMFTVSEGKALEGLNLRPGEVVGRSVFEVYGAYPQVLAAIRRALGGEQLTEVVRVEGRTYEVVYGPVSDAGGKPAGVIGTAVDVTERVRLEQRVLRSQKLESAGQIAGGVAHDFKNLLTAIRGQVDLLFREGVDERVRTRLERMRAASEHASRLAQRLLEFSRPLPECPGRVDLNEVVRGAMPLLVSSLGPEVDVRTDLDRRPVPAYADPHQLQQVLMNLVLNARDAMAGRGRLTVSTRVAEIGAANGRIDLDPGSYAQLTVADTGCGIDESVRSRLFEPFFTTKESGQGSGLGLAIVDGIVRQSRGSIDVESRLGEGASFRVLLPLASESDRTGTDACDEKAPEPPDVETVLVVEDNEMVRELIRDILDASGYQVLEATDGVHALEVAEAHEGTIHLVLTDVIMPRMGGAELIPRMLAVRPGVRVVCMSGHGEAQLNDSGFRITRDCFLAKPFSPDGLVSAVRGALGS